MICFSRDKENKEFTAAGPIALMMLTLIYGNICDQDGEHTDKYRGTRDT
jgi:hypothetical protein